MCTNNCCAAAPGRRQQAPTLPLAMGMAHPAATGTGRARWTGQRPPAEGEDEAGARREDPDVDRRIQGVPVLTVTPHRPGRSPPQGASSAGGQPGGGQEPPSSDTPGTQAPRWTGSHRGRPAPPKRSHGDLGRAGGKEILGASPGEAAPILSPIGTAAAQRDNPDPLPPELYGSIPSGGVSPGLAATAGGRATPARPRTPGQRNTQEPAPPP